ncbi:MAG: 5'-nucleotidase C-terminal domain-containing protein [Rhizobiaceae bacterium]
MRKMALAAFLAAPLLAFSTAVALADYSLTILHFNDWHSRIEPINKFDATCSADDERKSACIGGAARLKTAIDQERQKFAGKNVILLDAGDNFQGSLFYTTYKGAVEAEFTSLFKVDAMTVGNHEFDDGEEGLAAFLDKVHFPVLGANVLPDAHARIGYRVKPYVVLTIGGQKIGIVGAVANDTDVISSPGPDVLIGDDVDAITAAVKDLQKEGVNKIIALTHVGYRRDMSVIAKIPGVDVIVGGHSHTLLSNTDPKAAGPYPTFVQNPQGYEVPIVTAASYSKYLGEVTVTFDDKGVVKEASGDPIPLDQSIKPDPVVQARVRELSGPIAALKAKPVAEASASIDGDRETCRKQECAMGDLVADAMLERVRKQGVTISIINSGGVRASIGAGEVTMGEVLDVLPFQNTLATFQLSGKDIVAALENGVSQIEENAGRFPQVSGLRYTFDRSMPPNGGRIKSVDVLDGASWKPIDPAKTYLVVSNNYMRAGGDGYAVLRDKAKDAYDFGPNLADVLADYLQKHQPYTPHLDGRIRNVTPVVINGPRKKQEPAAATEVKASAKETPAAATAETEVPDLPAMSGTIAFQPPIVPVEPEPKEPVKQAPAKAPVVPEKPSARTYTVERGDSLWTIARSLYGEGGRWKAIADANPALKGKPIHAGDTLIIP